MSKKYKILIISDDEILKKYSIEQITEKFKDVNFIISAGDLSNQYLDYVFSVLNKDLIYINGNHIYNKRHNISFCKNIDGKIITYKGIRIMGLDGSRVYSFKDHQYTEKQMTFRILKNFFKLLIKKPDIVVSHAPPRGIHDKEDHVHKGFRVYLKVIRYFKPKLWIHGHIHLKNHLEKQETILENTKIVNAYAYKIIDFEL